MKKGILIGLIVLVVVALAGLGIWRYVTSGEAVVSDAGVVKEAHAARVPKISASTHTNKDTVVKKETAAVVARVGPVAANTRPVAPVVPAGDGKTNESATKAKASSVVGILSGDKDMMKNPVMKEMLKARLKERIDSSYGPLFKYLNLSDEDAAAFKNLLLDDRMGVADSVMDLRTQNLADDEKKDRLQDIAQTTKAFDEKIKALLGDNNFAVYKEYVDTEPEREELKLFKQSLAASDALTAQQENDLILAMHDERKNSPSESLKMDDPEKFDPSIFSSSEKMDELLHDSAQLQEKCIARAGSILTPGQLAQYKQWQEQLRAMTEMGMKVEAQMFGGANGSGGGSAK